MSDQTRITRRGKGWIVVHDRVDETADAHKIQREADGWRVLVWDREAGVWTYVNVEPFAKLAQARDAVDDVINGGQWPGESSIKQPWEIARDERQAMIEHENLEAQIDPDGLD